MVVSIFKSITNDLNAHSSLLVSAHHLADIIQGVNDMVLFLDIDGTLSEFHPDPQQSVIIKDNLTVLVQLQHFMPIWLVTGRSIADAKRLIPALKLPIIGSHGLECDNLTDVYSMVAVDLDEVAQITQQVIKASYHYPKLRIEQKVYGVALHFRERPELADVALQIMQTILQTHDRWQLKTGKCVYELLPTGVDKGSAIRHVLTQYYSNSYPMFIGDDITDEAGFIAVQTYVTEANRQGIGIKVGNEPTHANYYVSDVPAVTALLQGLLTLCQD